MDSQALITQLQSPKVYPHPTSTFNVIETHISWVILTGSVAYKIKKPVDFGFLNYTELDQRRYYCEQELRCNEPLASSIYQAVVTINQTDSGIAINGDGPIIEYALKMHQFSQDNLLSVLHERGALTFEIMTSIGEQLAAFHNRSPKAPQQSPFGSITSIEAPVKENFVQIQPFLTTEKDKALLKKLENWSSQQMEHLTHEFTWRKAHHWVRACHGDVHLSNITLINHQPVIFDAIEFNESFRWTDVMADTGFLIMDLYKRQCPELAIHFLNTYLSITGDYRGVAVLPYYISYRAMVRAKIQLFEQSAPNTTPAQKAKFWQAYYDYSHLAYKISQTSAPILIMMHGVSGSGKSTIAKEISHRLHAIYIRSDIERKRIFNKTPHSGNELNQGIYSDPHTMRTYEYLLEQANYILSAGYTVILDACYLKTSQRAEVIKLANKLNIQSLIISCTASDTHLRNAIKKRREDKHNISDATCDVLSMQQRVQEALSEQEQAQAIILNAEQPIQYTEVIKTIMQKY